MDGAARQNHLFLFGLSGSGHCSLYGVGLDNFDALTAMENWVEKGQAPDGLTANLYDPDGSDVDPQKKPLRTMPLCKFPETSMLKVDGTVSHNGLSAYDAVVGRRSIRCFLPTPVPDDIIDSILRTAARAPSGTNSQPWFVHVVTGDTRARLSASVIAAAVRGDMSVEYVCQPKVMKEPYLSRRRKVGFDLYALYGIDRHDKEARARVFLRNYEFFGAPVGLFVTMERDMELGSWLYCGMFIQNIMTIARAFGLETCPQQAWCDYGAVVHREIGIPDEHILVTGIAIGYADPTAPENRLITERVGPEVFAAWHR